MGLTGNPQHVTDSRPSGHRSPHTTPTQGVGGQPPARGAGAAG